MGERRFFVCLFLAPHLILVVYNVAVDALFVVLCGCCGGDGGRRSARRFWMRRVFAFKRADRFRLFPKLLFELRIGKMHFWAANKAAF